MRAAIGLDLRPRGGMARPLFLAHWDSVLMLHLKVSPEDLQRETPYPTDTFDGDAFVSLVAFTMRRLRPAWGGRWTAWLLKPIADHEFLNVRTYVRVEGVPGIQFLAEWLPNRLSAWLGPRTFALPYRPGRHYYRHEASQHRFSGSVEDVATHHRVCYEATAKPGTHAVCAAAGSLEEFLWERYAAFNCGGRTPRGFHVWHPPWRMVRLQARLEDRSLLCHHWPWLSNAPLLAAHYAPGFKEVRMSFPRRTLGV